MSVPVATTRLQEFWPARRPLLLLGRWCLPEGELDVSSGDVYQLCTYPWDDLARFRQAADDMARLYESMLQPLAVALGDLHGVSRDIAYWRVIVGPWLSCFVDSLYDRYVCLRDTLAAVGDIDTITLDPRGFVVPWDIGAFSRLCADDPYNLQLFTALLRELGVKTSDVRQCRQTQTPHEGMIAKPTINSTLRRAARRVERRIANRARVRLVGSGFARSWRIKLWLLSGGEIGGTGRLENLTDAGEPVDGAVRARLATTLASERSEFAALAGRLVAENMPRLYLEGFKRARMEALQGFSPARKVVTGAGCMLDERFKIQTAESLASGTQVLTTQHGGYYGMLEKMPPETHEESVASRYYSWGWTEPLVPGTDVRPMPAPLLSTRRRRRAGAGPLVLVQTKDHRYLFRFQSHPVGSQWKDYFADGFRFAAALPASVRAELKVRLYPASYGWGVAKAWKKCVPEITFDTSRNMRIHLESARLLIIDHPATSLLRAFTAAVPTVLFWNRDRFSLRESARPYFAALQEAGVLFHSPEEAAEQVARVSHDPCSWWESSGIRTAVTDFNREFARTDTNWLREWIDELLRESPASQSNTDGRRVSVRLIANARESDRQS